MARQVFKVDVTYRDGEHQPQRIAVTKNIIIRTSTDAENHCLKHLHYKDEGGEIFECVTAKAVNDQPFAESDAPKILSMEKAPTRVTDVAPTA